MAFMPASLAAKRAARRTAEFGLPEQYRISSEVKTRLRKRSPWRSSACRIRGTSVMSTPVPTIMSSGGQSTGYSRDCQNRRNLKIKFCENGAKRFKDWDRQGEAAHAPQPAATGAEDILPGNHTQ